MKRILKFKKFNESFSNQANNICDMILTNNTSDIKMALLLLKSSPEYIEEVSKAIIDRFTINKDCKTLDEFIQKYNGVDQFGLSASKYFEPDEIHKTIKLCTLDKYLNLAMGLEIRITYTDYLKSVWIFSLISIDEVRSTYINKDFKLKNDSTKEDILEIIYDLIDKHWNVAIKGKKTLERLVKEITNDVKEIKIQKEYDDDDEEEYDDEEYDDEE
jgi:hypothetical protein